MEDAQLAFPLDSPPDTMLTGDAPTHSEQAAIEQDLSVRTPPQSGFFPVHLC